MYNIMTLHKIFTQIKKQIPEVEKLLQPELKELKKPKGFIQI